MCNEAIILAGGLGTRLSGVISEIPKPMADVNGKPFLEYLLNYLERNGITHVILSVGYKSEIIKTHFGSRYKSIKISYATEKFPLGTGGGICLAIQKAKNNNIFIINGDTLFNISLNKLARYHKQKNAELSVALRKIKDGSRYGSVLINENNKITAFKEKSESKKNVLINGGIYLINKKQFRRRKFPERFSFEKDFLEKNYGIGTFYGFEFSDYFIDIGLPSTYNQAQTDFLHEFGK